MTPAMTNGRRLGRRGSGAPSVAGAGLESGSTGPGTGGSRGGAGSTAGETPAWAAAETCFGSVVLVLMPVLVARVECVSAERAGQAGRARQRDARQGGGETGVDLGVARAHQRRLGVDDFDVVGHPVLEPLARLRELV